MPHADEEDLEKYRVGGIFHNPEGGPPSSVIINDFSYTEGRQVGKYGIIKIKPGAVEVLNKLTGQIEGLTVKNEQGQSWVELDPKDVPKGMTPEQFIASLPEDARPFVRFREQKGREGRSSFYQRLDLRRDAVRVLAKFLELQSIEGLQDFKALNETVSEWHHRHAADPFDERKQTELGVRTQAAYEEIFRNCQKVMRAFKNTPREELKEKERAFLETCLNSLQRQ